MSSMSEGKIKVRVADEGCGISKQDAAHIFEPYYKQKMQRERNSAQASGLGLGLSICKSICTSLGGDI